MSKKNPHRKLSYRDKYLKITKESWNDAYVQWRVQDSNRKLEVNSLIIDSSLVKIAVEIRKIGKKIRKVQTKYWDDELFWLELSLNKITDLLKDQKVLIIDYTGKKYIEGMVWADIIAVEKDPALSESFILDTISPLIEVWWIIKQRSQVVIISP